MKNSKHTQGPWLCQQLISDEQGSRYIIHAPNDPDQMPVAQTMNAMYFGAEEHMANARLIAAGPELLEIAYGALKMHRIYLCQDMTEAQLAEEIGAERARSTFEYREHLLEVIAKATGGAE